MTADDKEVIWFTLWVSALSTMLILPVGLALAWPLARHQWRGKSLVETCIALPLVVPPVATGLILLKLFGRRGVIGSFLHDTLGLEVVFTWKAVVVALAVMSLPLMVRTFRVAFEGVDVRLEHMAATLGAHPVRVFLKITLPLAARGLLAGVVLAFARALGEFGATVMIAGNIPGQTSTLSLAIYHSVQLGNDEHAFGLLGVSVGIAFAAVWASEWLLGRKRPAR